MSNSSHQAPLIWFMPLSNVVVLIGLKLCFVIDLIFCFLVGTVISFHLLIHSFAWDESELLSHIILEDLYFLTRVITEMIFLWSSIDCDF